MRGAQKSKSEREDFMLLERRYLYVDTNKKKKEHELHVAG